MAYILTLKSSPFWLETYPQIVIIIYIITKKNLTRLFFAILLEISENYAFNFYK